MRALFHVRWLLALVLGLGHALGAYATHVRGGEFSYTAVPSTTPGIPRYHVLLTLYCDPAQLNTLQTTATIMATRGDCNAANSFSVVVPRKAISPAVNANCSPSIYYRLYTYETDLDLPLGQWTLSATFGNRVSDIVNISDNNHSLYLSAYLDNTLTTQDTSPKFESQLLPMQNATALTPLSFSAFDADADSLHYEFALPQQGDLTINTSGGSCGVTLKSNYSPHYQINPATGALTPATAAPMQGYYDVTSRVTEYRRLNGQWQLLGYVTREMIYLAYTPTASANNAPAFTALRANSTAQVLGQPIVTRAGQLLTLTLTAADSDAGQQLRFSSNAPNVVPGLSLSTLGAAQAQLAWQVPATLPPGRYNLALDVSDDSCPINSSSTLTLTILVTSQALATRPATNAESQAYPVPFREQVQFQAAPGQAVTLVDALGRTVARLSADASGRVLWQPAAGLPAGLYLARAADGRALARLLRE